MVEDTIEAYRMGRISELEYLNQMESALDAFRAGHISDLPVQLAATLDATAYYGLLTEAFAQADGNTVADLAVAIEKGVNRHKIRDWIANPDIANRMKGELDDLIYGYIAVNGVELDPALLDPLIDSLVEVAKHREMAR